MKLEKALRIGIDWISIYNFEIKYHAKYKVTEEISQEYYQERIRIVEPLFMLDTSVRLYASGKLTEYKILRFNPNKLLYGHNIYNSREEELLVVLERLKKTLYELGIELDLTDAKIKEIELNMNFNKSFKELKEALQLMFVGTPKLKKISDYEGGIVLKNMFTDGTFQSNWKSYKCIAYDKKREINNENILLEPLTRLEWQLNSYIYRYYLNKKELDTSLNTLLDNFWIVDFIFREHTQRLLAKKAYETLKKIKDQLESNWIAFKKTSKFSRENGIIQERNIYKYLEENCWIFDHIFLERLVEKYDKKNKKREIERIRKRYIHHNNLEELNYLMDKIFPH